MVWEKEFCNAEIELILLCDFYIFLLIVAVCFSCNDSSQKKDDAKENSNWALLPFIKADEVNPVLTPDSSTKFFCPVRKDTVKWEEKDVFNPAAW
jgi:hypothetical protein